MGKRREKVSIVVPTYNERENIQALVCGISRALRFRWDYEVIIVDDSSPDGTAEIVRQMAREDSSLKLLERPVKLGLGSAVVDGFRIADGSYWIMMDADLSHQPDNLPGLLETLSEADIVVGSRYVPGGRVMNLPLHRRLASWWASAMSRYLVGVEVRDATSGIGAFRREALEPILTSLNPKGFKLILEILANSKRAEVKEFPIIFVGRQYGKSKLTWGELLTFLHNCVRLRRAKGAMASQIM